MPAGVGVWGKQVGGGRIEEESLCELQEMGAGKVSMGDLLQR